MRSEVVTPQVLAEAALMEVLHWRTECAGSPLYSASNESVSCYECGVDVDDLELVIAELDATRAKLDEAQACSDAFQACCDVYKGSIDALTTALTAAQATIKAQEIVLAKALKAMDDAATVRNYMTGAEGRAIEAIRAALASRPSDASKEGGN